ncbi:protein of unknown function [Acidithiobacillus ferrivorans]|uniref:Uncharacterized protein n=1 Tax=Acidithiobacillus ferrivorans TaxID=160808 RepID=A0A060UUH5_9PROT|nr:hypothetical protein AFERRI_600187 [Acidithiobacillus ferrivorans]SMH65517.1 protein of unknown function [Acidithiobacillus ferrivorans]
MPPPKRVFLSYHALYKGEINAPPILPFCGLLPADRRPNRSTRPRAGGQAVAGAPGGLAALCPQHKGEFSELAARLQVPAGPPPPPQTPPPWGRLVTQ